MLLTIFARNVLKFFNVSGLLFVPLNHHPIFSIESQPTDSQYAPHFWQPTTLKKHLFGSENSSNCPFSLWFQDNFATCPYYNQVQIFQQHVLVKLRQFPWDLLSKINQSEFCGRWRPQKWKNGGFVAGVPSSLAPRPQSFPRAPAPLPLPLPRLRLPRGLPPSRQSVLLVAFYYAFKANNPQRIWSHFFGNCAVTKNTCFTEVTRTSKTLLLIFNISYTKIKSSEIERSIEFDCPIFLCEFDFVRLPESIELNYQLSSIEFDWVRLSSIEKQFDWVRLTMPG